MGDTDSNPHQPLLGDKAQGSEQSDVPNGSLAPSEPDNQPTNQKRVKPGVELAIFLYMSCFSINMATTQQFLYVKVANELNYTGPKPGDKGSANCTDANISDPMYLRQLEVQSLASQWYTYSSICQMMPACFATIFLGGYSDQVGRKPALISPLIGSLLSVYVFIFVALYDLPKYFILLGSFLEGLFGQVMTFMMACYSYVSDETTHGQRSFRIVLLEAVTGLGVFLSMLATGFMIVEIGFIGCYLILLGVAIVNFVYVAFFLGESVPNHGNMSQLVERGHVKFFTTKHFTKSFLVFRRIDERRPGYLCMVLMALLILILTVFVSLGRFGVQTLYLLSAPFCWSSITLGLFAAGTFLFSALGALGATKVLQKRIGDLNLLHLGLLSLMAVGLVMGTAKTTTIMFIATIIGLFSQMSFGMLRAFLSKIVTPDELGAMFSWISWIESMSTLIAQVSFNSIYSATLYWYKSFVFLSMAGISVVAMVLTGILQWQVIQSKKAMTKRRDSGSRYSYGTAMYTSID